MISPEDVPDLLGADARDLYGDKIGTVGQVYHDNATNRPTWVTVNAGLFGTTETVAPLLDARLEGWTVTLAHDKQQIRGAPRILQDGYLSPKEEIELCRYYGIGSYGRAATSDDYATEPVRHRTADRPRDQARDDSAERSRTHPSGRAPGDAMTSAKERTVVDTASPELGRPRPRMFVVAEQLQATVPVLPDEEHDCTEAVSGTEVRGRAVRMEEIVIDIEGRTDRHGDRPQ